MVISSFGSAVEHGGHTLENVPGLLKRLLDEHMWEDFVTPRGEQVHYDRFIDFLTTHPTRGIGTSPEVVRRIIGRDTKAVDLLDEALQNPASVHAFNNIKGTAAPVGTSKDQALRRLRKDRPDLHAKVVADELKPNAAMVLAGFRHKTFTVRADDPEVIARALRRHVPPEILKQVIRDLAGELS